MRETDNNKKQIKDRISYLEMELIHKGYHDGWAIEGMEIELKKLKDILKEKK
tara:strand:- start:525 stop:680 length:156 start_codon:yes stop_codon:yes gene_type:complete